MAPKAQDWHQTNFVKELFVATLYIMTLVQRTEGEYTSYAMEDEICVTASSHVIHIPGTGASSAILIKAHNNNRKHHLIDSQQQQQFVESDFRRLNNNYNFYSPKNRRSTTINKCRMMLITDANKRFLIHFEQLDIPDCSIASLQISNVSPNPGSLCSRPAPSGALRSFDNRLNLTWIFSTSNINNNNPHPNTAIKGNKAATIEPIKDPGSFTIIVTASRDSPTSPCADTEVSCGSGTCIDGSLSCDLHNNCGDRSDENICSTPTRNANYVGFFAIVLFVLLVISAIVIAMSSKYPPVAEQQSRGAPSTLNTITKPDYYREFFSNKGSSTTNISGYPSMIETIYDGSFPTNSSSYPRQYHERVTNQYPIYCRYERTEPADFDNTSEQERRLSKYQKAFHKRSPGKSSPARNPYFGRRHQKTTHSDSVRNPIKKTTFYYTGTSPERPSNLDKRLDTTASSPDKRIYAHGMQYNNNKRSDKFERSTQTTNSSCDAMEAISWPHKYPSPKKTKSKRRRKTIPNRKKVTPQVSSSTYTSSMDYIVEKYQ